LKPNDILRLRLANQQLTFKRFSKVGELVEWMGAIQAQDYAMSKWALGLRLNDFCEDDIEKAINAGEIFRVHTLRPTWHFVAAGDLRWIMALTAPHIKRQMATQNRQIGLTDSIFRKCQKIILELLSDGTSRTREEIVAQLKSKRIVLDNLQATNVMIYAELEMIVCNGPRRAKQFTYRLCEGIVPQSPAISREEALHRLAVTYFKSHGPATMKDFAWWSGLPKEDVKKCMNILSVDLESFEIDKAQYFYYKANSVQSSRSSIMLLPPYDEFTVGYADRDFITGRGEVEKGFFGPLIFRPVILSSGKAIGSWRREIAKHMVVETEFPFPISQSTKAKVKGAAVKYSKFVNLPLAK
jgi:hypothetical protein